MVELIPDKIKLDSKQNKSQQNKTKPHTRKKKNLKKKSEDSGSFCGFQSYQTNFSTFAQVLLVVLKKKNIF